MSEIYVVKETKGDLSLEVWTEKEKPLMMCGHTANATHKIPNNDNTGYLNVHCCVICAGVRKGYNIVKEKPDITGRKSLCSSCGKTTDSKWGLPFFEYRPNDEQDRHYDGCHGWD